MERLEQRLEIAPASQEAASQEPERQEMLVLVDQLEQPELCVEERLDLVAQLRRMLIGDDPNENSPPKEEYEVVKVRCHAAQMQLSDWAVAPPS